MSRYSTAVSRYGKISTRMWGDEWFRSLSAPQPNGQTLWMHLLTGPHTINAIPGLFMVGEAGMAEALGWPLEGFREAFREVSAEGKAKADWKARVVWLPKALAHNAPNAPNVVKSWGKFFSELPECELKAEAFQSLQAFIESLTSGFHEAFQEAFSQSLSKSSPKAFDMASPKAFDIHEHEHEHEEKLSPPAEARPAPPASSPGQVKRPITGFDDFWSVYPKKRGRVEALEVWNKLRPDAALQTTMHDALARQKTRPDWKKEGGQFVPDPARWLRRRRWEDQQTEPTSRPTQLKDRPAYLALLDKKEGA